MSRAAVVRPTRAPVDWARTAEARTLSQAEHLLREARANTRRVRDEPAFIARMAAELAASRSAELTRVFRNLIWVLPGFRKYRVKPRAGPSVSAAAPTVARPRSRVTDELCVVFVVRRKGSVAEGAQQQLPRWLITYADHGGQRLPFALRTDVQDAAEYHGAHSQSASALWVRNGTFVPANGSFVGLVRLNQGGQTMTCLLSAMHVLTPFAPQKTLFNPGGLPVMPLDIKGKQAASPQLATSLDVCGQLRSDARVDRHSFDAQLARSDDTAALRACVPLRRWNSIQPYVKELAELLALRSQGSFFLLTPDNHGRSPRRGALRLALKVMPHQGVQQAIPYTFAASPSPERIDVFHAELLGFECASLLDPTKVPIEGDSGSPIVALREDGTMTLVAMHIAGDGAGLSWAIPGWALFKIFNWSQSPAGATLEPLDA